MKTNVPIELSDDQRSRLADLIDRKTTKRKATRAEICAIAVQHFGGLLGQENDDHFDRVDEDLATPPELNPLYSIAPEDAALLVGKPAGYVRGWNLVKRSNRQ